MFTDFNLQLKYNQIHYWIVAILIGRKKYYSADVEISIQYYLIYGYLSVFFHYVFEKCQSAGEKKPTCYSPFTLWNISLWFQKRIQV